jgi:hypothetical protein
LALLSSSSPGKQVMDIISPSGRAAPINFYLSRHQEGPGQWRRPWIQHSEKMSLRLHMCNDFSRSPSCCRTALAWAWTCPSGWQYGSQIDAKILEFQSTYHEGSGHHSLKPIQGQQRDPSISNTSKSSVGQAPAQVLTNYTACLRTQRRQRDRFIYSRTSRKSNKFRLEPPGVGLCSQNRQPVAAQPASSAAVARRPRLDWNWDRYQ